MGYREEFFKANKGTKLFLKKGRWYKCVACGKWFEKANITVDHRIPKRNGGTDDLWNLQPMCKSCNSRKRHHNTKGETIHTLVKATAHGELHKAVGGMAKQKVKDAVGIKYSRK